MFEKSSNFNSPVLDLTKINESCFPLIRQPIDIIKGGCYLSPK